VAQCRGDTDEKINHHMDISNSTHTYIYRRQIIRRNQLGLAVGYISAMDSAYSLFSYRRYSDNLCGNIFRII
jgi:hypothetical protein